MQRRTATKVPPACHVTISRRSLLLLSISAVAALAFWLWPSANWRYRNFPPTADGPWVAFGDSLTSGYGASEGGSYPAQLSRLWGIPIENMGVPGETSADGLRRISQVEALNPRVVLLCFGGNDVLQNLPRAQMFANVGAMIDRLQARGTFVVLIGVRGTGVLSDANAKGFEQLAREKEVKFVPNILDGLLTQPSLMTDYVHPNDAGYARIVERLNDELKSLLPKLKAPAH